MFRKNNILLSRVFLLFLVSFFLISFGGACSRPEPKPKKDGGAIKDDGGNPSPDKEQKSDEKKKPTKGLSVVDLQNPKSANHPSPDDPVELKGVIVVSPVFAVSKKGKLSGFFVADPAFPKKWGGILVVMNDDFSENLEIGDEVDVIGAYVEVFGNSQVNAKSTLGGSIDKTGKNKKASIKATVVQPKDIQAEPTDKNDPDKSPTEPYEGMFVELKDAVVSKEADQYGAWEVKSGVIVDDNLLKGFKPKVGDTIPTVKGILHFVYDKYRLLPRFASDISGAKAQCTKDEDCRSGSKCVQEACKTIACKEDKDCRTGEKCDTKTSRCDKPRTNATIPDIQDPSKSPKDGDPVSIKGAVVTTVLFDASKSGNLKAFYVADPGFPAKFGGVKVVVSKDFTETLAIGDVVDIEGRVSEYFASTQVYAQSKTGGKVTKTGKTATVKAIEVKPADIPTMPTDKNDPDKSPTEPYEGMLVELKDITVESEVDKYGSWKIVGGGLVDDDLFKGFKPAKGSKITSIKGIIEYSYSQYRLFPRSASDISQPKCKADTDCAAGQTCDTASGKCNEKTCATDTDCGGGLTCNTTTKKCEKSTTATTVTIVAIQNPKDPKHPTDKSAVEVKGVIATSSVFKVSKSRQGFFVADPSFPSQWGGILVVAPTAFAEKIEIGDELDIKGIYAEYYSNSQIDISNGGKITKTGTNKKSSIKATPVKVADIPSTPSDPKAPESSKAEPYEGMLIELKGVTVDVEADKYGVWKLTGDIDVEDTLFKYAPKKGDKISALQGIIFYSYDRYRLLPRSQADITKAP